VSKHILTVKEFIEELKKLDQDAPIVMHDEDFGNMYPQIYEEMYKVTGVYELYKEHYWEGLVVSE